jgi:hypothetical protein
MQCKKTTHNVFKLVILPNAGSRPDNLFENAVKERRDDN